MEKPVSVDAYIASFPKPVRGRLEELRAIIRAAAPAATETIAYAMPAYKGAGPIVYFGGFKQHVSLFPTGEGVAAFQAELGGFTTSKGAIQLPLAGPLPADLITRIVKHRVAEDAKRVRPRKKQA